MTDPPALGDRCTRRSALRAGGLLAGGAIAGCVGAPTSETVLSGSFESGTEPWEAAASIGPEEAPEAFEWRIQRSRTQAASGDWSLEVFTEGDHDDGTAWVSRELIPPSDADGFDVSLSAWSASESFNTLRHLVAYLGPERPDDEDDFPDPGMNSTAIEGAPYGGLREPLHLAEGWREYTFRWDPESVASPLFLAVGVSVVWEADATHYIDDIEVQAV